MKSYLVGLCLVFGFCGIFGGVASAQTLPIPTVQFSAPVPDFGTVDQVLVLATNFIGAATTLITKFAPEYWDVNVQQVKNEATTMFFFIGIWLFVSLVVFIVTGTLFYRAEGRRTEADRLCDAAYDDRVVREKHRKDYRQADHIMDYAGPVAGVSGVILLVTLVVGSITAYNAYLKNENPRYYAIERILNTVSK